MKHYLFLIEQNLNDDIFKDHPELNKLFIQLKHNKNIQAHHILVLLLRLRQLCCHPCLMKNVCTCGYGYKLICGMNNIKRLLF